MATVSRTATKPRGKSSSLTEAAIQRHVGERSFARGREYFEQGAIYDCQRQDEVLKAHCQGQSADHYLLHARVTSGRIAEAVCSCPVGAAGDCKHIAALLLSWLDAPEEFQETEPLQKRLAGCTAAQLIDLIGQMLEQQPELEEWLELALPTAQVSAKADEDVVQSAAYRRRTEEAFAQAGYGWEADRQLTAALTSLQKLGEQFHSQKRFAAAAAVFGGILDGFIGEYETFQDETGNIVGAAMRCIEGLGNCLSHLTEGSPTRRAALQTLFDVLRFDINFGGISLSDDIPDILGQEATPAERTTIVGWIRGEKSADDEFSSNWRRQTWGGILLDLEGEPSDDEAFLKHCREYGLTSELVNRLLERGRLDDAIKEIQASSDYDLMGHADRLIAHQQAEVAQSLVQSRRSADKNGRNNRQLREWLKQFYETRKDWTSLLQLEREEFLAAPRLAGFEALRKIAKRLKIWKSLRGELIAAVPKDSAELIRIHLSEGDVATAIQLFQSGPRKRRGFEWDRVDLEVAQAAETSHPETSLPIYLGEAERLIATRGRENYQAACEYLQKVKRLFTAVGRKDDWLTRIATIRAQNRSLRALHEEMTRAGL